MDYGSFFNGDVTKQIAASTYTTHRDTYVHHLQKSVTLGHITQEEADKRLEHADSLHAQHTKSSHKKKVAPAVEESAAPAATDTSVESASDSELATKPVLKKAAK